MKADELIVLKDFLLDIDCLSPLSKWIGGLNFFEVARISRAEIRHSNMLAWLMDPMESHGLGDKFLQGIFQELYESQPDSVAAMRLMLLDYYSFSIKREWENIDILAVSEKEKCVVAIENKIDSKENRGTQTQLGQLPRYQQIIEKVYEDYRKFYIFLTPDGEDASCPEIWQAMNYETVLDIAVRARAQSSLTAEAGMLIDHYIDLLRRKIVKDQELIRICNEIYTKHKKALDLIFENRSDRISDVCMKWAASEGRIMAKGNNTVVSFTTAQTDAIFPQQESNGAWNDHAAYYYQIRKQENRVKLSFVLDLTNTDSDGLKRFLAAAKDKPRGKKWWTAATASAAFDEDHFSEETFIENLDKAWQDLQKSIHKTLVAANLL